LIGIGSSHTWQSKTKFSKTLTSELVEMKALAPIFIAVFAILADSVFAAAQDLNRPNIILMMADDMGMGDTSAYQDFTGNADRDQVHTPQMERLARMGIRFTDAHTPSSRCSPTRYGLLTGRYPWRNRLKHWVLFGSQGDPMIEADRPTFASMLKKHGYRTAMFGKWHVGLRFSRSDGSPAAGWDDADLSKPLHTSPLDHGFDVAWYTSRSHLSSGPTIKDGEVTRVRGPGHIDGRFVVGATGSQKGLVATGANAYILEELGSKHSDNSIGFMTNHIGDPQSRSQPFFLYYPANSNHGPHTPDTAIGGVPVAGAARNKDGQPTDTRNDYVYENDVALGRMIDWLEANEDPRNPGSKLIDNTMVIFTSDNGAEKDSDIATGPFRSNKASSFEGGHRVPFIVAWKAGGVGDGSANTPGQTSEALIGLQDVYATFSEIVGERMPNYSSGQKGGEDSYSILAAMRDASVEGRSLIMHHDHKEAGDDPAVAVLRLDSPEVNGKRFDGQWKLFFNPALLRQGKANPYLLYDLKTDQMEATNLIDRSDLKPLIGYMTELATLHRNAGGHRLAELKLGPSIEFDFRSNDEIGGARARNARIAATDSSLRATISAEKSGRSLADATFTSNSDGLGISEGDANTVDGDEALLIRFNRNVVVEHAALLAKGETAGGHYRLGEGAPLSIYCVNADIDDKDQSGVLSDLGVFKAGQTLRLDSRARFSSEDTGNWSLQSLSVRVLE
jgi:arylsulfatase A